MYITETQLHRLTGLGPLAPALVASTLLTILIRAQRRDVTEISVRALCSAGGVGELEYLE